MSPLNYPFLLTMEPLADAISAGNTAIIKPSAYSPATSAVIEKIINEKHFQRVCGLIEKGKTVFDSLEEVYSLLANKPKHE